jgi:alkylated DNA repair dioxygenase AlkB
MQPRQFSLLEPGPALPEGLKYQADWLPLEEERELVGQLADLPFRAFEFQGYVGRRRVVSFGWQYDFNDMRIRRTEDIPSFLLPLRERAAVFADLPASELQHVLLTEYAPGAAIGWHKDKAVFGKVVGISLLSTCVFRLRQKVGSGWKRASFIAEPRSAYILQGLSRTEWEHSIPAVDSLRYSITFRNLHSDDESRRKRHKEH